MQAGLEAGKWGPLQGEEQVQQLGVQSCGTGDPIYQAPLLSVEQTADATPSMPGLGRLTLTESSDVDMWNPLLGGHQEQVQQHGTMGAPSSSAYPASYPLFTTVQNVGVPASMPGPMEAEGLSELNIESTVGQPSSPLLGQPVGATMSFEDISWEQILQAMEPNDTAPQDNRTF
jgi:hypothetical protein